MDERSGLPSRLPWGGACGAPGALARSSRCPPGYGTFPTTASPCRMLARTRHGPKCFTHTTVFNVHCICVQTNSYYQFYWT